MKLFSLISRLALTFLLVCFLIPALFAQPATHTRKFSPVLDNNINGFLEYLPRNYATDINVSYPLLIYIHGAGDMGSSPFNSILDRVKRNGPPKIIENGTFPDSFRVSGTWYKFIVISPQIKNGVTEVTSTIQPSTIDAVVEYAKSAYRVDARRIYVCGMSMGGGGTWDYAGSSVGSRKLAAIAVAAGAADLTTQQAANITVENVGVIATHNTVDNIVAVSRTMDNVRLLEQSNPLIPPKTLYWSTPGANNPEYNDANHNVWSRTFEDILPGSSVGGNLRDSLGMNVYEWLLQYQSSPATVPLVWEEFTVKSGKDAALLQWRVSEQRNVKSFIIEKSADGLTFTPAGSIPAHGEDRVVQVYQFTDPDPFPGFTYYRIRQVDLDEQFSYSVIRKLESGSLIPGFSVFPNPFTNRISITLNNFPGPAKMLRLSDAQGRTIKTQTLNQWTGVAALEGLQQLPPGIYFLLIYGQDGKLLDKRQIVRN